MLRFGKQNVGFGLRETGFKWGLRVQMGLKNRRDVLGALEPYRKPEEVGE